MSPLRLVGVAFGAILLSCGWHSPSVLPPPHSYFLTQYEHPKFHPHPTPSDNANCGPVSLAMALQAFQKVPAPFPGNEEDLIAQVREALTGSRMVGSWTYPSQFPAAAQRFGLRAQVIQGGADAVIEQLARPGRLVIVNVNPSPAYASQLTFKLDGGHFALATGVAQDRVFLNDPLAPGPMTISRAQLETALSTPLGPGIAPFAGGIALWKE